MGLDDVLSLLRSVVFRLSASALEDHTAYIIRVGVRGAGEYGLYHIIHGSIAYKIVYKAVLYPHKTT